MLLLQLPRLFDEGLEYVYWDHDLNHCLDLELLDKAEPPPPPGFRGLYISIKVLENHVSCITEDPFTLEGEVLDESSCV